MSSLNRSLLRRDGYVILRNVIPAEELDAMREVSEAILDRQREIWRREAGPDDPPGGVWDTRPQPRVSDMERLVDADTARAVELWLGEPVLGVCRELLCLPEASPMLMSMMCNPRTDHGPAKWHRDIHPIDMAPLRLLQAEILETGPRYLQWNIPLYDDDVLWVVPGSHRRLNTPEEERQLEEDPRASLPGGVPVDLKAGDGVVYNNCMLHWGSNYAPKLRRTLHGGHAVQATRGISASRAISRRRPAPRSSPGRAARRPSGTSPSGRYARCSAATRPRFMARSSRSCPVPDRPPSWSSRFSSARPRSTFTNSSSRTSMSCRRN